MSKEHFGNAMALQLSDWGLLVGAPVWLIVGPGDTGRRIKNINLLRVSLQAALGVYFLVPGAVAPSALVGASVAVCAFLLLLSIAFLKTASDSEKDVRVPNYWAVFAITNAGPLSLTMCLPVLLRGIYRRGRLQVAVWVLSRVALAVLGAIVWIYLENWHDYKEAWSCYGSAASVKEFTQGYCPSYSGKSYWESGSTVCRGSAMNGEGNPIEDACRLDADTESHWKSYPRAFTRTVVFLMHFMVVQMALCLVACADIVVKEQSLPSTG